MNTLLVILKSNRAKAAIIGFGLAIIQKHFPDFVPTEETLNWIYGIIIAFIAGDTIRPIDPEKPQLLK